MAGSERVYQAIDLLVKNLVLPSHDRSGCQLQSGRTEKWDAYLRIPVRFGVNIFST